MADEPKKEKKEKTEQNDRKGGILKSHKPDLLPAVNQQISIYQPSVIVDCHMHIMSGNCSTLPFLWSKASILSAFKPKRVTLQSAAGSLDSLRDGLHIFSKKASTKENMAATADQKKIYYRTQKIQETIKVSKNDTYTIGDNFMIEKYADVFKNYFTKEDIYKGAPHLMFFCVVMTMDMEYAHLDGYYGLKVCNAIYKSQKDIDEDKEPIAYWMPLHKKKDRTYGDKTYKDRTDDRRVLWDDQTQTQYDQSKPDLEGTGIPGIYHDDQGRKHKVSVKADILLLDGEAGVIDRMPENPAKPDGETGTARYEQWKKQVQHTELAMLANPLKLLPLFHYDPRRWQVAENPPGNTHPFEQVGESGLYLGFKMYTAQGYRPWDSRLPILREFYARCVTQQIPIMNHCTPDGAPTFDREEYVKFEHPLDGWATGRQHYDEDTGFMPDGRKKPPRVLDALEYFNTNFVAPKAWEKVLEEFSTLRICLAHFGGAVDLKDKEGKQQLLEKTWCGQIIDLMKKYPNVYADLSSSFANEEFRDYFKAKIYTDAAFKEKIRKRILFGTDWYMTLLDGVEYMEYCMRTKKFLDDLDTSLWLRFTQVNPYKFYRLDEQIGRIARNIIDKRQHHKITIDFFGGIPIQQTDIALINKEAAYIKIANKAFIKQEEFR